MNTSQALKLYIVLSRAYHAVAEADKDQIRSYGLGPSEFAAMELLFHKGPQPIQQIAAKVLLTSGSMTYVVSQLEKKGLVTRSACEKDRRVFYAALTEDGAGLIRKVFPAHETFLRDLLDTLTGEETENLTRYLRQLGKTAAEKTADREKKRTRKTAKGA